MTTFKKLRVGVFMGGRSIEREVSFNSGRTICDHIDQNRFEAVPIFQTNDGKLYLLPWYFLHRGKIADFMDRLGAEAQLITWDDLRTLVDFIYPAVHGRFAEDGTLQGFFEVLGIPYMGSKVLASALGMNKHIQKDVLKANGIDVPKGITVFPAEIKKGLANKKQSLEKFTKRLAEEGVSFPVIVKPAIEGSSKGVSVAHTPEKLFEALIYALECNHEYEQPVIVEEKIEGKEFTFVGLQIQGLARKNLKTSFVSLANQTHIHDWVPLPLTEIVIEPGTEFYDYDQKYMPGRATKITPAPFSAEDIKKVNHMCIEVARTLSFRTLARIDGFLTKEGRVVITDPNTLTGMAPSSFVFQQAAFAGLNHAEFINYLIDTELQQMKKEGTYLAAVEFADQKGEEESMKPRIRVAVLSGGDANEREISLETGRNVCYKLSPQKYEVTPLFVTTSMELYKLPSHLHIRNATHEIVPFLTPDLKLSWSDLPQKFDFVFIGLHGGKGENGSVQGVLEMLGMPYNGSGVLASALCMDKQKTKEFLASHGFAVPRGHLIKRGWWNQVTEKKSQDKGLKDLFGDFAFPLIVKPSDDGCSFFVKKVRKMEDLAGVLDEFFKTSKNEVMVEECIMGMELTVGVIGNDKITVLPASYAISSGGNILSIEDKFLPGQGENQTPAPLNEYEKALVQHTMYEAYKAIGCKGYVRIDCFYQHKQHSPTGEDRVVILEVNSLPGLTPATCIFHQAAEIGMKPMDFIDKIVEFGLELHRKTPIVEASVKTEVKAVETPDQKQPEKPAAKKSIPTVEPLAPTSMEMQTVLR